MANKWIRPFSWFVSRAWYGTVLKAGDKNIFDTLDKVAGHFVKMLEEYKDLIIDDNAVKDVAKTKYPNMSLKLLIKSKTTRHVDVGIFNQSTAHHMEDIKLESNKGVSDSLYVGQVLYV